MRTVPPSGSMWSLQSIPLLLLLVLLPLSSPMSSPLSSPRPPPRPCPRSCSCPQPTELHCTFRSLLSVPAAVSRQVERINLGFNSISRMTERSLAGMRRLEILMIHGNELQDLPDGAFRDLTSLQMLKMSYNKLREISRKTLHGLCSLSRLHLDHNRLEFIHADAFQGLTSLKLLQLEGNALQQLHPDTFSTFTLMGQLQLSTVRSLYLSDNALPSLPSRLLETMPQLENLYLHGNPWSCDCSMRWLHGWDSSSPGVLKCKKDRAAPGGQLCPVCSSPRNMQGKQLQSEKNLGCSRPIISSPHRISPHEDMESEVLTVEDFREPLGNMSLGLSDEHGNEVALDCSVGQQLELSGISWEQVGQQQLEANVSLSVDLHCSVDREKYEQLWRLIAYYSSVPAHLQRAPLRAGQPPHASVFRQDSERDALYYTGVAAHIVARPSWLLQSSLELQLNRAQSSSKTVRLILRTSLAEAVEAELSRRQRRQWVMIQSTNATAKVFSSILGARLQMDCRVQSSGRPLIQWRLPDGSTLEAPSTSPDRRASASADGRLIINSVGHRDTGSYYCVAKAGGDVAVLPFFLAVQESSSPPPGEKTLLEPVEQLSGTPISLPCRASASPEADISWILPSGSIVSLQANSSRAFLHPDGTLLVPQAQSADGGYYKCVAINQHGVDTLATKVSVERSGSGGGSGLLRPLRRTAAGPQSVSGVNTKIKVPLEDTEEASGDMEVSQETAASKAQLDPLRRRIPGGVASGRRRLHPLRNMRPRPPVLRKPTGSRAEDGRDIVESRRRINVSKSRIDPEKWADILAKIRERKPPTAVTPTAVRLTTAHTEPTVRLTTAHAEPTVRLTTAHAEPTVRLTTAHAEPTVRLTTAHAEPTVRFTTAHAEPTVRLTTAHTEPTVRLTTAYTEPTVRLTTAHTETTVGPQENTEGSSDGAEDDTATHAPAEHTHWHHESDSTRSTQRMTSQMHEAHERHTTPRPKDAAQRAEELQRPSGVLPLATSAPTHALSPPPASTHTASGEKLRSNSERVADGSDAAERENRDDVDGVSSGSSTDRGLAPTAVPFTRPNTSDASQEENGKYLLESATSPPVIPAKFSTLQSVGITTASPVTSAGSMGRRRGYKGQPHSEQRPEASRRRNGGRRRRPKGGRQRQKKPQWMVTTQSSASTPPNIQPSDLTTATFRATVPFSSSQATSSGGLSHEEHTVSSPAAPSSNTQAPPAPLDQPAIKSTTEAPLLSDGSPHAGQRNSSQSVVGVSASMTGTSTRLPSPTDMEESRSTAAVEARARPGSESSSEGLHATTPSQSGVKEEQSDRPDTFDATDGGEDIGTLFPPGTRLEATTDPHTASSSMTTWRSDPMFSRTTALYVAEPQPGSETSPSLQLTTRGGTSRPPVPTTAEPAGASDHFPESQSPTLTAAPATSPTSPTLEQTTEQRTTHRATKTTAAQTEGSATPSQHVSGEQQLPGQRVPPSVKARILRSNISRVTVSAEQDAVLPCQPAGTPPPFLSWTRVASGASIAQNTRLQRFEVHQNGTLTIRNAQLADGGQYRCTVRNQYGTDQVLMSLVVLAPPPQASHPQHRDVTVHLGANIDLECKVDGRPVSRVTWVLPSQAHMAASPLGVASQQHVSVLTNGTLRIHQATYADRGVYKCISSSPAGVKTLSVELSIAAMPPVIRQTQQENQTLTEGSAAYLHCTASGAPQPAVRWTTPGGAQPRTSRFDNLVVFPNGTLYMHKVGAGNAGRYECLASNAVASSARVVYLKVVRSSSPAKAVITAASPQSKDVIYGGTLLLNCVASGQPEPRIMWKTPAKKLVDAQYSFDPRIRVFPNGTISVNSVTNKDGGDYLCAARNKMGDDYVVLRVNVLTRPAKIEKKQQPSSREVTFGGDLKVDCVASGLPDPQISWLLPDGTTVNTWSRDGAGAGHSRRLVVFANGTLFFSGVGTREDGDYTCYAKNQLGEDQMKVRVKVKVSTSAPQIQQQERSNIQVFLGETVSLRCDARGAPAPLVSWISPSNTVISPSLDKYQVLTDGTLLVQKVQRFDSGNYTCVATNPAGEERQLTRLEVLVVPPTINGLRGTDNAVTVVSLQDRRELVDCLARGNPTPRVLWVLPGNVVLPAPYQGSRMRVHHNGTLEIPSPQGGDSGLMVCVARNEGGEVRLLVKLEVKEPPVAERRPLTAGSAMTLNCSSEATWILPDGTSLLSGTRSSKFFHRADGSLTISNPSLSEAGTYRCLRRGREPRLVLLAPGLKPYITNSYGSTVSLPVGETLLLHCLSGGDHLRLAWTLPSAVVLERPQRAGRYAVLPNGTLAIQQVSPYDRGSYVCRAANEYGSSALAVSVSVLAVPPRISSGPPSVTYAKRGVAIQLNCAATGTPKAEVAWETPDRSRLAVGAQPRLFGNKYLHPEGALVIQTPSARDAGIYRCVARNSVGVDSRSTLLNVF